MHKKQLDGLRFISFLGVFLYHTDINKFWFGSCGVYLFFVLSGFLITNIILSNASNTRFHALITFYARRFLRIFPAYYLLLTVLYSLGNLLYAKWHFVYLFNVKLFLLSLGGDLNHLIGQWESSGIHFWTLCVEEQFYLIFPLILLLTKSGWRIPILFFLLFVSIILHFICIKYVSNSFYGALLPVCGEYLLLGALFACFNAKGVLDKIPSSIAINLSLAAIIFLFILDKPNSLLALRPSYLQTFYGISFSFLVWGLWASDNSFLVKILSLKPLSYLGKISYGLYLYHLFMWDLSKYLVSIYPELSIINLTIMRFLLTMTLAIISWHLWEYPINSLKRYFPYVKKI